MSRLSSFGASFTWNPSAILDGNEATSTRAIPGAKLGDFAFASLGVSQEDLMLNAYVVSDGSVKCQLANNTGGTVDIGLTPLHVVVVPREIML